MPTIDLYRLILQNIKNLDPDDAIFELQQLSKMTKIDFTKEIHSLNDPTVTGRPDDLKKTRQQITAKFKEYQKQKRQ